jgi:hypothetical protein
LVNAFLFVVGLDGFTDVDRASVGKRKSVFVKVDADGDLLTS